MRKRTIAITPIILLALGPLTATGDTPKSNPSRRSGYTALVQSHLERVTQHSVDTLGKTNTRMWLATIDVATGGLPKNALPHELRWYRKITSPNGSNLYWDQPTLLAAYTLSLQTGDPRYSDRADDYVRDFLERCVAEPSGLFQWGNHVYYDVVRDQIRSFNGGYHECRPHTPAWEIFWKHDPAATSAAIRAIGRAHIKDIKSGRFCRHANPNAVPGVFTRSEVERSMPFLEAGASLIDSLSWLAMRTGDQDGELTELALRAARYSFAQRSATTGLVRNQPVIKRWDYDASTTEVGLWAGSLSRASVYTGEEEFGQMAEAAVRSWLRFGFDDDANKYYGRLAVESGLPQAPEEPRGWIPPMYAEVFDIHERPTHNYPMPMAETCLRLFEKTGDPIFEQAVEQWVLHIRGSLPANKGRGAYAEDYGRVIHFLTRSAKSLNRPEYRDLARKIADEAIECLFVDDADMFRSHPGEDRCDAVDGPGVLLLALLYLDTATESESAFAF